MRWWSNEPHLQDFIFFINSETFLLIILVHVWSKLLFREEEVEARLFFGKTIVEDVELVETGDDWNLFMLWGGKGGLLLSWFAVNNFLLRGHSSEFILKWVVEPQRHRFFVILGEIKVGEINWFIWFKLRISFNLNFVHLS